MHFQCVPGAVVLQITCFSEAERIYMLAKDTTINGKQLYSLVIPEITVGMPSLSLDTAVFNRVMFTNCA